MVCEVGGDVVGAGQIGSRVFVLPLNRVLKKKLDLNCRDYKVVFLSKVLALL